jgi:hypothetical protein
MPSESNKADVGNIRLPFRIHKVTSQDENFPATELLISDLSSFYHKTMASTSTLGNMETYARGWQSQRFWSYPQEIILGFPWRVKLNSIKVQFHEHKVPSKIQFIRLEDIDNELFDGTNAAYDISQRYQKLPERSTKPAQNQSQTHTDDQSSNQATNEESKSQSETNFGSSQLNQEQSEGERDNRTISESSQKGQQDESKNSERAYTAQLKTNSELNSETENDSKHLLTWDLSPESTDRQQWSVDINDEIKYVKIKLFKNHENKLNVFNQIGIISILCFGEQIYEKEKQDMLTNLVLQKSSTSTEDISQDSSSPSRRRSLAPAKTSTIDIFDDKIAALTTSKNKWVDNENYVEADKLKQIIAKIEKLKNYIWKLETQKFEHASNEDYDQAKKLKNEINRIKNVVLSITSGDTNAKPKIVAPYGNT